MFSCDRHKNSMSVGPLSDFDIIIGGASFAGLALARALTVSSDGALKIALVDKISPDKILAGISDGRAFAMSASSVRLLEVIGVWESLAQKAQPIVDIEITDSELEQSRRPVFIYFDNALSAGEAASFMVESGRLRKTLLQHVLQDDNCTIFAPDEIDSFEAGLHGVDVTLKTGGSFRSPLLAAADGRESTD